MNRRDLADKDFTPELITECLRHRVVPIAIDTQQLTIAAIADSLPTQAVSELAFTSGRHIKVIDWPAIKIEQHLQRLNHTCPDTALIEAAQQKNTETSSINELSGKDHDDEPVVQFINQVIRQALQRRASDIHFEPYSQHYRIRLRIDGALQETLSPPLALAPQLIARLKIMAQLNIAERRLPQDGQLIFHYEHQPRALRIATIPVNGGEKAVLRVMESDNRQHTISSLGMNQHEQQLYSAMLQQPQGMILVTGPTGSGKTVTLYSGLHLLNDAARNICSVEDPIEIPTDGINQTQVNTKTGVTFNSALRALLRQDPDVLMIGEIRDKETAEIAVEAAQTGHLVLATLHTNSTTDTLLRLSLMGIPEYLLAASLKLVVAQRLIRRLCPHCKEKRLLPELVHTASKTITLYTSEAKGCENCSGGYYGRVGIYEMLVINDVIKQGLLTKQPVSELHRLACEQGMVSLFQSGLSLVEQDITSLSELYKTLGSFSGQTVSP
ncbi:type II secretion system protein GspE [Pragia fontium]|uniref:Type II secretion system protein GspE n=1 Tax=Pragia fontium TaxID=82985 RepID=A0ABQ5LHC4_9GAMM|nr:ATPase, T2SS/T4P/T4SS family [Pragia fontium]GKX63002.1 type II secretion system protein GspE [Pragia fontium]